jgi:hypothetical protein
MRVLMAMRISTGTWFRRCETSDKTPTQFRGALAAELGLSAADVHAIAAEDVTPEAFEAVQRVLERGIVHGQNATVWPPGDPDASLVWDADSVDEVTAARVRRLFGGANGQRKWEDDARQHAWAAEHATWPGGRAVTDAERIAAETFLAMDHVFQGERQRYIAEARAFKNQQGFF